MPGGIKGDVFYDAGKHEAKNLNFFFVIFYIFLSVWGNRFKC